MRSHVNAGPIMVRGNADLSYINEILVAHQATDIVYRMGPAREVQLVVPTALILGPQSAVIRTVRPNIPRLKASSNLRAAYRRFESSDNEAGSAAAKSEDAERGDIGMQQASLIEHREERHLQSQARASHQKDRLRDRETRAAELDNSNSEDTPCENDHDNHVGPTVTQTHRAICATDFQDSEDEDSFCDDDDIRGLNLDANTRLSICHKESQIGQEDQLKKIQLRIQKNVLRDIVQQALKASRNGQGDSNILCKETAEEEDRVLELILELMEMGQAMNDAGTFQGNFRGEEGRDIQMMVRNIFRTLMRKATRPFRPSGVRVLKVELSECLEAFREMRFRLLEENPGRRMKEILKEKSLDLRPR